MTWEVPLVELEVTDGDVEEVLECLRSGWLTMGPRTQRFEEQLSAITGTEHAVAVSSGTAALHLACRAAGLGPGDEVIVPSLTFAASAHAPRYCGADAVLCDSGSVHGVNASAESVERAITDRTKAVMAVHMWGYPAPVEEMRALCDERGLILIEDCAEAISATTPGGSTAGSVGHVGCFSFFSKKQLAVGEGGAVSTDDAEIAAAVRSLRSHAMTSVTWERHKGHGLGYDVTDVGFNYRIDEPRAALGLSRLTRLEADIAARRAIARGYREGLGAVDGLELPFDDEDVERSSHFVFPVLLSDRAERDAVRDELKEAGIQTTCYPALHTLTEYAALGTAESLPNASALSDRHVALPIYASMDDSQRDLVVDRLGEVVAGR